MSQTVKSTSIRCDPLAPRNVGYWLAAAVSFLCAVSSCASAASTMNGEPTWLQLLDAAWKVSDQGQSTPEQITRAQDSAIVLGMKALDAARREGPKSGSAIGYVLNRLGDYHFRKNECIGAESLWVEAYRAIRNSVSRDSTELYGSQLRLGIAGHWCGGACGDDSTVAAATEFRRHILTDTLPGCAAQLWRLAQLEIALGHAPEFYQCVQRMVSLWEQLPGSDARYAIRSLVYLAEERSKQPVGNIQTESAGQDSAISLATRALRIADSQFGPGDTLVAFVANRLSDYYMRAGRPADAAPLIETAWRINTAVLPPEHIETQGSICRMASVYRRQGRYPEAERLYREAVVLRTRTQGAGHPETGHMYMALGSFFHLTGRFVDAEQCYQKALSIFDQSIERVESDVAEAHLALGDVAFDQGGLAKAEREYRQALEIRRRSLGDAHGYTADCLLALAELYQSWGRLPDAEAQLRQALDVDQQFFGAAHLRVAAVLERLSSTLVASGHDAEADSLLRRAAAITFAAGDSNGLESASLLTQLALIDERRDSLGVAYDLLTRAVAIRRRLLPKDDYRLMPSLCQLASAAESLGRGRESDSLYELSARLYDRVRGRPLPECARFLERYALHLARTGRTRDALAEARDALHLRRELAKDALAVMAERDALNYVHSLSDAEDLVLSLDFAGGNPDSISDIEQIASDAIMAKGTVTDFMLARSHEATSSCDPAAVILRDSLQYARSRLAHLFLAGPSTDDESAYSAKLADAEQVALRLERDQARVLGLNGTHQIGNDLTADSLQGLIPDGDVIVDFHRFNAHDFKTGTVEPTYFVYVLGHGQSPVIRKLGPATGIDSAVAQLSSLTGAMVTRPNGPGPGDVTEYLQNAEHLSELIWQPIASAIPDSETLLISPDAALNAISFAALPGRHSRYLIEEHPIQYLATPRDLVEFKRPDNSADGLLAIGNPNYDQDPVTIGATASVDAGEARTNSIERFRSLRGACADNAVWHLSPLPGTQLEIEAVAETWRRLGARRVDMASGSDATESLVRNSAAGHRVLHFATHAFWFNDSCSTFGQSGVPEHASDSLNESPLLLSGICLTGANHVRDAAIGGDDGILTAEEICNLNLEGTDWVVLTACHSGLGRIVSGEGIFGLRRAFQLAGARTVISSLWEVPDQEMPRFIQTLYAHGNESLPAALQRACIDELRELRARSQPDHPFLWAGLVAVGDWRGLGPPPQTVTR